MQSFIQTFKKMVGAAVEAIDGIAHQESAMPKKSDSLTAHSYQPQGVRDTVIVQDVSGSMADDDYTPTRLDGGLQAALEYYTARKKWYTDDRIALVAFNHEARIIVPLLSLDREHEFRTALQTLTADGGTDIAKGLHVAAKLFDKEPLSPRHRHVILLSDGHGGDPLIISEKLKSQYHAQIDVIGIGGDPSAVDEPLLRRIATIDLNGYNHYRFIKDAESLRKHYQQLATGLMWTGGKS